MKLRKSQEHYHRVYEDRKIVEVVYEHWKKIVIHEIIRYELDDLVKLQSLGVEPGGPGEPLLWSDGIVFSTSTMLEKKDVIKEKMEGVVHWSSVEWASMPGSREFILIKETNVKIPVINASAHPVHEAVSRWLKEHQTLKPK